MTGAHAVGHVERDGADEQERPHEQPPALLDAVGERRVDEHRDDREGVRDRRQRPGRRRCRDRSSDLTIVGSQNTKP